MELVALLQRQEFSFVEFFQSITDSLKDFWLLLPPVIGSKPAEHCLPAGGLIHQLLGSKILEYLEQEDQNG